MQKKHGAGAIDSAENCDLVTYRIPTGVVSIDYLTDGGLACNRVNHIWGEEGTGKSFLLYCVAREGIRLTGKPAFVVDSEQSFSRSRMEHLGIAYNMIDISRPPKNELAWKLMADAIESQAYCVVGLDSIAALPVTEEIEAAEVGDHAMLRQAQKNNEGVRRIHGALNSAPVQKPNPTCVMFINQLRQGPSAYDPDNVPGGKGQLFISAIRMKLAKAAKSEELRSTTDVYIRKRGKDTLQKKEVAEPLVRPVQFKIEKNKVTGEEGIKGRFSIVIDERSGLPIGSTDVVDEVLQLYLREGILEKGHGTYILRTSGMSFEGSGNEYFSEDDSRYSDESIRELIARDFDQWKDHLWQLIHSRLAVKGEVLKYIDEREA